jgi:hypothetical protein
MEDADQAENSRKENNGEEKRTVVGWKSFSSDNPRKGSMSLTLEACIILATSTFVFPLTDAPLTPTNSSPLCNVPSLAAGVLSNTCIKKAAQIKYG